MPRHYQNHSQHDWQQIMNQYAASGLSQTAFCQRKGLALSTFSKWRKQLVLVDTSSLPVKAGVDFKPLTPLPLPVVSSVADHPVDQADDWEVELVFGGGRVLRIRGLG